MVSLTNCARFKHMCSGVVSVNHHYAVQKKLTVILSEYYFLNIKKFEEVGQNEQVPFSCDPLAGKLSKSVVKKIFSPIISRDKFHLSMDWRQSKMHPSVV